MIGRLLSINPWVLLSLVLALVSVTGGVYLKGYYSGKDVCESATLRAVQGKSEQARVDQEKVKHEEQSMEDSAIDDGLRDLGIMRPYSHR